MNFLAWHNILFLCSVGVGVLVAVGAALGSLDLEGETDAGDGDRHEILGLLDLGQIPFTVLLLVASLTFGVSGVAASLTASAVLGTDSPWVGILLVALALAAMLFLTGRIARAIVRHLPASETHVMSASDLVGHDGTMFTSKFADVCVGADVHRIECRCDVRILEPGSPVHLDSYDPDTGIYAVTPLTDA